MAKEKEDLERSVKKTRREHKDVEHELLKKISSLEDKIKDLNDYKLSKVAEEKELKSNNKKLDKRTKMLTEKEAKIEMEKTKLEKEMSEADFHVSRCNKCEEKFQSEDELNVHKTLYHSRSSSTQTNRTVSEDKLLQTDSTLESSQDKESQTSDENSFFKTQPQFKKYPCFYCSTNIAGENHLKEHRIKCRGTNKMGVVGLPPASFGFFPGFPQFPPFSSFTGFDY